MIAMMRAAVGFAIGLLGAGCSPRVSLVDSLGTGSSTTAATSTSSGASTCTPTTLEPDGPGVDHLVAFPAEERVYYVTKDRRIMMGDLETGTTQLLGQIDAMDPASPRVFARTSDLSDDILYYEQDGMIWGIGVDGGFNSTWAGPFEDIENLVFNAWGIFITTRNAAGTVDVVLLDWSHGEHDLATVDGPIHGLVLADQGVIFADPGTKSVLHVGIDDGAVTPIVTGVDGVRFPFVRDKKSLYLPRPFSGAGEILRTSIDGTDPEEVFQGDALGVVADPEHYWILRSDQRTLVAADFPTSDIASAHVLVESDQLLSPRTLARTYTRLVYTVQDPGEGPSIRTLCFDQLGLP